MAKKPAPLSPGPTLIRTGTTIAEFYEMHSRENGLTSQQARLLFILAEKPTNMLGLGSSARLSKSTMTSLVDRMEVLGLLERSQDPGDRRRLVVSLTPHGRKVIDSFQAAMIGVTDTLLASLHEEERATLTALLTRVLGESDRLLRSE